jgi:hypothetical protein
MKKKNLRFSSTNFLEEKKKGFVFSILHLKHCVKSKNFYTNNLLIFWSGFDQFSFFPVVYNDKIKMVEKSRTFFSIMI